MISMDKKQVATRLKVVQRPHTINTDAKLELTKPTPTPTGLPPTTTNTAEKSGVINNYLYDFSVSSCICFLYALAFSIKFKYVYLSDVTIG